LAERHVNAADADVSNLARASFMHHAHFFTFVDEEGVAPTNNVAARAPYGRAVAENHIRESER
jgi:hypothetical protein